MWLHIGVHDVDDVTLSGWSIFGCARTPISVCRGRWDVSHTRRIGDSPEEVRYRALNSSVPLFESRVGGVVLSVWHVCMYSTACFLRRTRTRSRSTGSGHVDVEATKAVLVREGLVQRVHLMVEKLVGDDVTDRYNVSGALCPLASPTVQCVSSYEPCEGV